MRYSARPDDVARTHQALAEVNRLRLLELLRAGADGLDATQAAAAIRVHVATARSHLETLVAAGLAERMREERTTRGRPRIIYRAAGDDAHTGGGGYRFLAELLASIIESGIGNPAKKAEIAGVAWGRELVERARPLTRLPRAEAVRRVQQMLDQLGFAPEVVVDGEGERILLHRCPFGDVAVDHQDVVCSAHLGLIKGALDQLGASAEAATLRPLVEPTLCIADLGRRAS
jgi:predicted ArsR family transcriptional regulator